MSPRDIARRTSHLTWTRVCVICTMVFKQHRIGRPRLTCSGACYRENIRRGRRERHDDLHAK